MNWQELKEKMGANKLLTLLIATILFSSSTLAVWLIATQSGFTGEVISVGTSPVTFVTDFNDIYLDTTTTAVILNSTGTISNNNGDLSMYFHINETTTDNTSDDCTDYINDCITTYYFGGEAITEGTEINISNGNYNIDVELSCERLSCPQSISTVVLLDQTP